MRSAYRRLDGISRTRLKRNTFGQAQLGGNRRLYHFLLSVCRLIYESSLVDETTGRTRHRQDALRQATRPNGPEHEGILLYPQVGAERLRAKIRLEGFRIQARTVNLDQDWRKIHKEMLEAVGASGG